MLSSSFRTILHDPQVKINKTFQRKIVNIFKLSLLTFVLGAQKNRLIETVLLSTHNIFFG